ncbi:IS1 family transposase [Flagellimonas onchidii]|uniref:IS1 family transposase n=1 Tax=Flagellimonas onchidii TaxID=2562684 RepID=UPI0010A5B60B|nr:IS1 family transposase [Allomuricauda onchidii]
MIKSLLREGCGVRDISRVMGISAKTILSRIIKIGRRSVPPQIMEHGRSFEVDELWSFVGSKSNSVWITYAIERKTKQVIGFFVGRKTRESIRPLIDKLLLLRPKRIYTDGLNIYPGLIPREIHRQFQYSTNRIERLNLTLRTHIKRLSRKTICFSKKQEYLVAHLKICFWDGTCNKGMTVHHS